MSTDAYVDEVARRLTLPPDAAAAALADLRASLDELLVDLDEEGALAALGPAAEYAAALNDEFAVPDAEGRLFGVLPNSFGPGLLRRLAGTFDPANPRVLVPKVFGGGWTFNSGAIAARLGLVNPDDLDDEIAAEAVAGPAGRAARLVGSGAGAVGVLLALRGLGRTHWVNSVANLGLAGVAVGLAAASASESREPDVRLAMPGVAAYLGTVAIGTAIGTTDRPQAEAAPVLAGLGVGAALSFALKVLPLRAAVAARAGRGGWSAAPA